MTSSGDKTYISLVCITVVLQLLLADLSSCGSAICWCIKFRVYSQLYVPPWILHLLFIYSGMGGHRSESSYWES